MSWWSWLMSLWDMMSWHKTCCSCDLYRLFSFAHHIFFYLHTFVIGIEGCGSHQSRACSQEMPWSICLSSEGQSFCFNVYAVCFSLPICGSNLSSLTECDWFVKSPPQIFFNVSWSDPCVPYFKLAGEWVDWSAHLLFDMQKQLLCPHRPQPQ